MHHWNRLFAAWALHVWLLAVAVAPAVPVWASESTSAEASDASAASATLEPRPLRRMIDVLADDTFEGREAGSRGGQAARGYLVQQLQRSGLRGGAGSGGTFLQAFGAGYHNILAQIPGQDPKLRDEYIVISAHYDHVGYGKRSNSLGPVGYIHNGADDNASGCALLIELARALNHAEPKPARSLYFALWDAEEKGLLGSEHWLLHGPIPRSQIRLMINLDMVGRLRGQRVEVYGARTIAGLRHWVSQANGESGLQLDFRWQHKDNSDHHSFFARSIPYLMFHTGLHEDYHRPSDDPERVNVQGMVELGKVVRGTVERLAHAPQLGSFRAASRAETEGTRAVREQAAAPLPSRLGIRWSEGRASDRGPGLTVQAVQPHSAAWRAGLRAGDRIVALDGQAVDDAAAFVGQIWASPPEIVLTIERDGEAEPASQLPVRLGGQPMRLGLSWRELAAEPHSVMIVRVVPGTPAWYAGMRVGDRLLRLGSHSASRPDALLAAARRIQLPVEVELERQGRILTRQLQPLSGER